MRSSPPLFRFALTLVMLAGMLMPAIAMAAHDLTCHPPEGGSGRGGAHEIEYQVVAAESPPGVSMSTLTVRLPRDGGSPHVSGAIVLRGETTRQPTTWTAIALAESGGNTGATAQCADGEDADWLIGLTSLVYPFRHAQSGEIARIVFVPDREIDESGAYHLTIQGLTDREVRVDVEVRLRGTLGEAPVME